MRHALSQRSALEADFTMPSEPPWLNTLPTMEITSTPTREEIMVYHREKHAAKGTDITPTARVTWL
jgi:hypothetical protein